MAIALIVGGNEHQRQNLAWYIQEWQEALSALDPSLDVRIYPDIGAKNEIEFLFVADPSPTVFQEFPHVKGILALTAGVELLVYSPFLLPNIPLVRLVDPYMALDICQYAVAYVLNYVKRVGHWQHLQTQHIWEKRPPFNFSYKTIGVMGLGHLGGKVAEVFAQLGFTVNGWSQIEKNIPHVRSYAGQESLPNFLQATDILICLLPLTHATRNILNKETFSELKKEAYIINMGRGEHLVEDDLLAALDKGQLSGATLDVFRLEPLPPGHRFWNHPNILVTPHIASVTNAATAAPIVLQNMRRIQKGEEPIGKVDLTKGY